jgi:hypothetical protein
MSPVDEQGNAVFPFYQSELEEMFGSPQECEPVYCRVMNFMDFANDFQHVRDWQGNPWRFRIYGNLLMEQPLRTAFGLLISRGLAAEWRTFDGCHNIRPPKGGSMHYSVHAWGLAIDMNAGSYPYGSPIDEEDPWLKVVRCFADCGFEWGGLWSTPDGMHFQLPWIRDRVGPLAPVPWRA